ncbi:DUF2971 domain-containing protein [Rhizobium sp. EC-SD404]|uniref:DUF2971 domain-containing protein n=1 Tax=Rhizobium sp. EC-SD404 TaxID=2038389 RepID=UPI00125A0BE1|nr:DUF2971 domain-containing protein [Rhizobium sp. EC-SD404]VVS98067.1 conserved hypothetical protein [Rhizobium sp. EC-SD404]
MRRLYHFLKGPYAVAAIEKRRLRISRIEDLNDAFEFIGIALDEKRDRIHLSSYRRRLDMEQGIICMSETWSKPQMWGHYGDSFRGMALGFDVSEEDFIKVRYRKTKPRLADLGLTSYAQIGPEHLTKLMRIKSDGWAYEEEWRWQLPLANPQIIHGQTHYFQPFGPNLRLREVVAGPKFRERSYEQMQEMVKGMGVEVLLARGDFAKFEITRQRQLSLWPPVGQQTS